MKRREAVLGLIALGAAPLAALAQQQGKLWRIGILAQSARPASLGGDSFGAFLRGMRELGYVEGRNLAIEWRYAEDKLENLPALAAELVALKPDVLVSGANAGPLALQRATSTIPIVMTSPGDSVAMGLVKSLARPGGNITGNSGIDLSAKRLELLLAMAPNASPVALLFNPGNTMSRAILDGYNAAAKALGTRTLPFEMQPTIFELVINLKTAKALGLKLPPALLARADRVIE